MMVEDYMLDKVLDKLKQIIGIKNLTVLKYFMDTNEELQDGITLKNILILITFVTKDDNKFYQQPILQKALFDE